MRRQLCRSPSQPHAHGRLISKPECLQTLTNGDHTREQVFAALHRPGHEAPRCSSPSFRPRSLPQARPTRSRLERDPFSLLPSHRLHGYGSEHAVRPGSDTLLGMLCVSAAIKINYLAMEAECKLLLLGSAYFKRVKGLKRH